MVKALFFDLTDTLQEFDWQKQWGLLVPMVRKELGIPINKELFVQKYQQVYESYRLGWIRNDFEFFELLFLQQGFAISKTRIAPLVKKHLEIRQHYTCLPEGYAETLKELGKEFKLAVTSSGVASWCYYDFKKIFGFDFKKDFDFVVFSSEAGFLKESGILFGLAQKKLQLNPSQAAFVGNEYASDIVTAKRFGLKTIFLNKKNIPKKKAPQADMIVTRLKDLAAIKEKLKKL